MEGYYKKLDPPDAFVLQAASRPRCGTPALAPPPRGSRLTLHRPGTWQRTMGDWTAPDGLAVKGDSESNY